MKISLCIITIGDKELHYLKGAVESVLEAVDSVHITANGEETKEVEKWCKEKGYDYSYLKWNKNFSEQRNYNFARAPKDTDYVLWMDADDVLIGADQIREVAKIGKAGGYDTIFFDYWYSSKFDGEPSTETFKEVELEQKRERLINPRKMVWKKRIHETPVPLDGENFKYTAVPYSKERPITWLHLGADHDITEIEQSFKMMRNQELLELELEDERKEGEADPRTILYLMKIYAEHEDEEPLKKCIELGKEYSEKSGWDQERAVCYQLMSKCMGKLGDSQGAREYLMEAINEYPYNPLLHLYLARAFYNLGNYRAMKFWMKIGLSLGLDKTNASMGNLLELKMLSAELLVAYHMKGDKNVRKALEGAKLLNKIYPHEDHQKNVEYLEDMVRLDKAAENIHMYFNFLRDSKEEDKIAPIFESLPETLQKIPVLYKYYNRYRTPRTWGDNEICYFANFGQFHVQKWDGDSLKDGLGGSETAVIRLSEELTKKGYKVTVFGDPVKDTVINGVTYLPFYKFNQRDSFNIFIQWRNSNVAGRISAKKFFVDLHDVTHSSSHIEKINSIDKIFVKSNYHRTNIKDIPNEKVGIISNGI